MSDDPANGDGGGKKKKSAAKQQPQFAKDDQGNLILPPDMPEIDVVTWQVKLQKYTLIYIRDSGVFNFPFFKKTTDVQKNQILKIIFDSFSFLETNFSNKFKTSDPVDFPQISYQTMSQKFNVTSFNRGP